MILVTGDIHAFQSPDEVERFSGKNRDFKDIFRSMTKEDYVIICGDFGLVWDDSAEERYWRKWLGQKPFTTLFIDGNHENFDRLYEYPAEEWHGGRVSRISDSILWLRRGQVFTLQNRRFFTLGGAESHDKEYRTEGISWWPQELPTEDDLAEARRNLDAAGWEVDYVLTHSLPTSAQKALFRGHDMMPANPLTDFLEEISSALSFREWYSGHYHLDGKLNAYPKMHVIYHGLRILE